MTRSQETKSSTEQPVTKCAECKGWGFLRTLHSHGFSTFTCFHCGGTGWIDPNPEPQS